MRLGYFADGPWAHRALDAILADGGFDIAFLVLRHERPDPVLRAAAVRLDRPCYSVANVNEASFVATVASSATNLLVSMSFDQILKRAIREAAPLGFINCHAGALPFYRGRNVINWALINGEQCIGITVHHVDEGIDTGDIIQQDLVNVEPDEDYATVLEKAFIHCPVTLMKALRALRDGTAQRKVQSAIHATGSYFPRRAPGDEWIDWSWPSHRIHNFVRAIAPPGPGARATLGGESVAVLKTRLVPDAPAYIATPGAVVGRQPDAIWVKCGDSFLAISRLARIANDGQFEQDLRLPAISARFSGKPHRA
jgi:methionyl-tRNA formyltransferase